MKLTVRWIPLFLLLAACAAPSPDAVAAQRLVEGPLSQELGLTLEANCGDPVDGVLRCEATTADGRIVLVVGRVGADEIAAEAVNVIGPSDVPQLVETFERTMADAALPPGVLECGSGALIGDSDGTYRCGYQIDGGGRADVVVSNDGEYSFDVHLSSELAATGIIHRVIGPELGFEALTAQCDPPDGDGFECRAILDDGRTLEFLATITGDGVEVTASNVFSPAQIVDLSEDLAAELQRSGRAVADDAVLDCGGDLVVVDDTGSFACTYRAPGQVPVVVVVSTSGLGTDEVSFQFDFVDAQSSQGGGES